ncbi:gem-associated protein 2-like isoform X2 [Galleria mellonella]|uniref:Gem-associated protein 2 n=1 Tax=Galleria mellonella TaxID=7137 RepID=A0A6J1WZV1_GALME|nr:gem-associated protein 2-like isoform X2 [Galleria mellonella]
MSSNKYIYKATRSNDDDAETLVSPCFHVGPEVQLKEVPTTGEEYLLKVIKERQNYSTITKCNKDYSKFSKNQSCFIEETKPAKAPDKLKPTIEWQNIQVADFSDVRMYLSRIQTKKTLWPSDLKKISVEHDSLNGWKQFFNTNEPTLTCVLGLKHTLLDRGLEILTEILEEVKPGFTVDYKTGQWIYAFLACTRQPLLSDTISILRNLARKCAEIRSCINPEEEDAPFAVTPLNIFICLVARYFRQYDLAD